MAEWNTPKTDWVTNPKNPVAEDFNRIEGNIAFLKGDIETKKGAIVNALNTVGLETQLTDTHAQIANKIVAANQGTKIYTPSTVNQPIPKGFHSGQGYVKGDVNLVPANIAKGKSIFGVNGSFINNVVVSVQQGRAQASTTSYRLVVNHSAVDTSRVLYIVEPEYFDTEYTTQCYIDADSITPTSFEIVFDGWVERTKKVVWKIFEFDAQIVKSLQRGNVVSNYQDPYYIDVAISAVNRNKVIYISQYVTTRYYNSRLDGNVYGAASMLTSNTNLRFYGYDLSAKAFWQVLEFY